MIEKVSKEKEKEVKKPNSSSNEQVKGKEDQEALKAAAIEEILSLGKKKGVVTYKDIMDTFDHIELAPEEIDGIYELLTSKGIDFAAEDEDPKDNEAADIEDDQDVDLSLPEGIALDDPVRMYLKEIGRVPFCRRRTNWSWRAGRKPVMKTPNGGWPKPTSVWW